MATTEPGTSSPTSPRDVGRHLRSVRKARGLSRSEVARSAGLTRRELAAYERGKSAVPDSDLWCLAGSCGVDVGELLPPTARISVGSDLGALTVGESVARLRPNGGDGVLREYLAMVYELRNLPPGAKPPMRDEDLATLAEALGGTPDAIEARLHELIGASREEAVRLRSMILPPRPIAASAPIAPPSFGGAPVPAPPVPVGAGVGAGATAFAAPAPLSSVPPPPPPPPFPPNASAPGGYAPPTAFPPPPAADPLPSYPPPAFDFAPASTIGDPAAADRFFAAPHADDPFAPPPPLEALASGGFPAPTGGALPPPLAFAGAGGFAPPDPTQAFGAPVGAAPDPFAPPAGPPLGAPGPAPVGPASTPAPVGPASTPAPTGADAPPAEPVRPDGFVADLGGDGPDVAFAPFGAAPEPSLDQPLDLPLDPAFALPAPEAADDLSAAGTFAGAAEMVVLDVGPDGTVLDADVNLTTEADPDRPIDDDPFAILRIPIEELDGIGDDELETAFDPPPSDPFDTAFDPAFEHSDDPVLEHPDDPALEHRHDAVIDLPAPAGPPILVDDLDGLDGLDGGSATGALEGSAPVGLASDAPEAPVDLEGDDEPGDEWFDRAAAAADALIAEQRHDGPVVGIVDVATVEPPDATTVEPPDVATVAMADALPTEPETADDAPALDPIVWSLGAPASAPARPPVEDVDPAAAPDGQFVAAGSDWEVGGLFPATAMADDGALALRRADVRWALADLAADGDVTIRAHVAFTSGAGFGILFRVSTDDSERITGYSFDVDPIYAGGGFLIRQWNDSRQHWKPLAHAPVTDPARLFGAHLIEVALRNDTLTASIDGEPVMHVDRLSRASVDAGHEPCRGGRVGVQAFSTTEVTVDRLLVARH